MSLEVIKQNALAIQQAGKLYDELVANNAPQEKIQQTREYILKLAYHIQQEIDEEVENVG